MDVNELLFQAAVQTIDALSFTQSHVIDEDFRAHSRATIESVRSLQREQRSRVEQTYGPRAASHETLAAQLTAAYRGEIASLELAKEAEAPAAATTASMTHSQCQAFKKDMKQRIHEWERAFREERGVTVTAHDKAALRHVYELYKAAKNRLRDTESPRNGSSEQNPDENEGKSKHVQQQQQQVQLQQIQQQQPYQPPPTSTLQQQQQQTRHQEYITRNGEAGSEGRSSTNSTLGIMPGTGIAASSETAFDSFSSTNFTGPASVTSSVNLPRQSRGPMAVSSNSAIGNIPVGQMSNDDLASEKRHLKRILHHFESEFEQRNGRVPAKSDRWAFTREYTRYGELKNEIQRRSSASNNQKKENNGDGEPPSSFGVDNL